MLGRVVELVVIVDMEDEDDGLVVDGGDDEENAVPTEPVMPVEATEYR